MSLPWSAQEQHRTGSAQDTGLRFQCSSRSSVPTSAGQQTPFRHGTSALRHNRLPFGTGLPQHRNQQSRVPGPSHPGIRHCTAESYARIGNRRLCPASAKKARGRRACRSRDVCLQPLRRESPLREGWNERRVGNLKKFIVC